MSKRINVYVVIQLHTLVRGIEYTANTDSATKYRFVFSIYEENIIQ